MDNERANFKNEALSVNAEDINKETKSARDDAESVDTNLGEVKEDMWLVMRRLYLVLTPTVMQKITTLIK